MIAMGTMAGFGVTCDPVLPFIPVSSLDRSFSISLTSLFPFPFNFYQVSLRTHYYHLSHNGRSSSLRVMKLVYSVSALFIKIFQWFTLDYTIKLECFSLPQMVCIPPLRIFILYLLSPQSNPYSFSLILVPMPTIVSLLACFPCMDTLLLCLPKSNKTCQVQSYATPLWVARLFFPALDSHFLNFHNSHNLCHAITTLIYPLFLFAITRECQFCLFN